MNDKIYKLLEQRKTDNPYKLGTLSHGIWEQTERFSLQWEHFDHFDWHQFFEQYNLHEEFERGVILTDDLMHQPTNRDFVFNLFWSILFSPERVALLEQCFYYKGEEINPFENHRGMLWNYESCWVRFNLDKTDYDQEDDLHWYKQWGLSDLCPNDGVPMTMKALLLNRYLHWGGGHETPESFRRWYVGLNYTDIHGDIIPYKILMKDDLEKSTFKKNDFVFFWGHHEKKNSITKACLSQWYPSHFTVNGIHYTCAEQYMMAEKARIMGDEATRAKILKSDNPEEVKALGRQVENFDANKWNCEKINVVLKGNLHKFLANDNLREYLTGTGEKILVEASPYDCIWGIGLKADAPEVTTPKQWRGENLLGFALMKVREILKNSYKL